MRATLHSTLALLLFALAVGCGDDNKSSNPEPVELPYETLSEWGFFEGELAAMNPTDGVVPYTVNAPLWADNAYKGRFIQVPPSGTVVTTEDEGWVWPEGTIFIKTFYFDKDLSNPGTKFGIVETRLLYRHSDSWESFIYVWNEDETEATLLKAGKRIKLDIVGADGGAVEQTYIVPNTEECKTCHEIDDNLGTLGLTTSQLDRDVDFDGTTVNQLDWFVEKGLIDAKPVGAYPPLAKPFDETSGSLEMRARAYLHGNCGHCHREGGGGGRSGLRLVHFEDRPNRWGVCKSPVAAGHGSGGLSADIVPGHPEDSILVYRMSSTDPEIKMPELPNLLPDDAGVELISQWITEMEYEPCDSEAGE